MEAESLVCIEKEICRLEAAWVDDPFVIGIPEYLHSLFQQKQTILDHKEETLRQQSRDIWLRSRD